MSALPAGTMREALIDVGAIAENVRHLRRLTQAEVIAVVKADGYGHGASTVQTDDGDIDPVVSWDELSRGDDPTSGR